MPALDWSTFGFLWFSCFDRFLVDIADKMLIFALKKMNFASKMMDVVGGRPWLCAKLLNFAFKTRGFVSKTRIALSKIEEFCINNNEFCRLNHCGGWATSWSNSWPVTTHDPSFWIQNSWFLLHNSSFLLQISSFQYIIHHCLFKIHHFKYIMHRFTSRTQPQDVLFERSIWEIYLRDCLWRTEPRSRPGAKSWILY